MGLRLHVNNLSSFHISTEFRAVKEKHDFFEVCQNPELACEVTLQVTVLIIISSIGSAPFYLQVNVILISEMTYPVIMFTLIFSQLTDLI